MSSADARFKIQDLSVAVEECRVEDVNFDMYLDRGYFLNVFLKPLSRLLPGSIVRDHVCAALSDRLAALRNRFAM